MLDTETTGKAEPVEVIELATLFLPDPPSQIIAAQTAPFVQRYRPSKAIELGALAIHHILDEELAGEQTWPGWVAPPEVGYIVGHNIDYDWARLGSPSLKRICTLALARVAWPELDSYSLSALIYHIQHDRRLARSQLRDAHSAGADVLNSMQVLRALADVNEWPETWEAWHALSELARIPKTIPFGMHKGKTIAELPLDYRKWILKQPKMDPYIVAAVKATLPPPRDSCRRCGGARGGVPGNENLVGGILLCDYCHGDDLRAAAPPDQQQQPLL